jgi:hypothetical protein
MANTQLRGQQVEDGTIQAVDLDLGLSTDQVNAQVIPVDSSVFTRNLTVADVNIQHALDTIDQLVFNANVAESEFSLDENGDVQPREDIEPQAGFFAVGTDFNLYPMNTTGLVDSVLEYDINGDITITNHIVDGL